MQCLTSKFEPWPHRRRVSYDASRLAARRLWCLAKIWICDLKHHRNSSIDERCQDLLILQNQRFFAHDELSCRRGRSGGSGQSKTTLEFKMG
ncbi:hypothetical protein KC364_g23 [Hortaea werneckii]|nr:hypothetical protein KC364_g23 [Hortaea werneckii]